MVAQHPGENIAHTLVVHQHIVEFRNDLIVSVSVVEAIFAPCVDDVIGTFGNWMMFAVQNCIRPYSIAVEIKAEVPHVHRKSARRANVDFHWGDLSVGAQEKFEVEEALTYVKGTQHLQSGRF